MHLYELQWLIEFAQNNSLPIERIDELIKYYIYNNSDFIDKLEIETKKHLVGLNNN